jgi:hypothetical protein
LVMAALWTQPGQNQRRLGCQLGRSGLPFPKPLLIQ